MTIHQESSLTDLKDPVLVAGFVTHRRGGRIGSRAAAYLVGQWQAQLVARIDSEDYVDFTVDRPETRYVNEVRTVKWPDSLLYLARPEGARNDILLLVGFEPNVRWRRFGGELAAYIDAAGVKTLVSLRGLPASVPHTRPAPIYMTASDPGLATRFGEQAERQRYEGPTDILGVVASFGQQKGWQTVDLSVLQPAYYPRMRNAAATMAVVDVLDRAFGTSTSIQPLEALWEQQLAEVEDQVPPGEEFRTMLQGLEQLYDDARGKAEFLVTQSDSELPTGDELISEVERLLRRQEGSDPS